MDKEIKKLENLDVIDLTITISQGGFTLCRAAQWSGKDEYFRYAKLYYPTRGEGWVRTDGRQTVLKPRHLYLIPPCRKISFGTPSTMSVHWLHFYPQAILLHRRLAACTGVVCFSRALAARWAATCHLISRLIEKGGTSDACHIQSMLLEVIGTLLAGLPEDSPEERAAYERLLPALKLLEIENAPPHSLADLARTVSFSPEHFHRLFRKAFHTTPLHYALRHRMNLAQQLLSEGRLSVAEVAGRCGYEDAFYFSKVFRRHFGITPKKVSQGHVLVTLP